MIGERETVGESVAESNSSPTKTSNKAAMAYAKNTGFPK